MYLCFCHVFESREKLYRSTSVNVMCKIYRSCSVTNRKVLFPSYTAVKYCVIGMQKFWNVFLLLFSSAKTVRFHCVTCITGDFSRKFYTKYPHSVDQHDMTNPLLQRFALVGPVCSKLHV